VDGDHPQEGARRLADRSDPEYVAGDVIRGRCRSG
jgi:hypothetical protein